MRILILSVGLCSVLLPIRGAAQSGPENGRAPVAAASLRCDVRVVIESIDPARHALKFWTTGAARRIAATLAVFANNTERYDIEVRSAYAAHALPGQEMDVVPVALHFGHAVSVNAAAITSIDGTPCNDGNSWIAPPWRTDPERIDAGFRARFDALPAQQVPPPTLFSAACAKPFVYARVRQAFSAEMPMVAAMNDLAGISYVRVVLDDADRIVDARIAKSSGYLPLDTAAVDAARRSTFESPIFNCRKTGGEYVFGVSFG